MLPHEDQPHKDACVVAYIRNQSTSQGGALLLPKAHIRAAAEALNLRGILAVLDGRTDDQDKLREREILTNKSIRDWLCNHSNPEYRRTGQLLVVFGNLSDMWDRSGLNDLTRKEHGEVYMALFEALAGKLLRLPSGMPAKILGISANLLFVLCANVCSHRVYKTCFPNELMKERNVGTYACEGFFSTLVVSNGGHKPTAPQAVHVMRRAERVAEIRFMPERPFYEFISKRQHYDHSANALSIIPQKVAAWNDGSALAQTDRSRESGKKRKCISAERHVVAQVVIREYHKKRKTK